MERPPDVHLYLGRGDRVREIRRTLEELAGQMSHCRYDCWFQKQTGHTMLILSGACTALRERLEGSDGWYLQPLEWKRP